MANSFLLKYSATSGVVPTSAELPLRQIALNTADGKLFIKKNDGSILTFESAAAFARAVHSHVISDVTGLQDALDTLTSAAAAAQAGADASLKSASNLSDLGSASTARANLGVDSSAEVDGKISTSKTASDAYTDAAIAALINGSPATLDTLKEIADALAAGEDVATALTNSIAAVSSRVDTLEGQNLDNRITTAQSAAEGAQSTADSAVTAAAAAQSTADSAVSAASTAQSAADAAQSTADSAVTAAAAAQSGADASLKIAANLGDLADAASSRSNLGVDSSAEVDSKVSTAVSSAQSTLQGGIDSVSGRVTTLEGQNLDSRLTSAEGTIAGLGTMSTQNADNITITGGLIGAGSVPTDSGVILTENSTIDGGTFSGFNGGGGGGGSTPWYSDSSTAARALTLNGTVTQANEGGGIKAMESPSAGYFSLSNTLPFDDNSFTVEGFYKPNNLIQGSSFFGQDNGSGNYPKFVACILGSDVRVDLYVDNSTTATLTASSSLLTINAWNHIAVSRDGSSVSLCINGNIVATTSFAGNLNGITAPFNVGWIGEPFGQYFDGKIAAFRAVIGSALYSGSTYTVPTSVLGNISGTELLLNFEATAVPTV